jgi:hypothetical protein
MNISFDRTDTIPIPLPQRHGLILMDNYPLADTPLFPTLKCSSVQWRNCDDVSVISPVVDEILSVADNEMGKHGRSGS